MQHFQMQIARWYLTLLLCGALTGFVQSGRILALVPFNARSHFQMLSTLFKGLAERGHQVDVLNHFPQKTKVPNYTDISVAGSAVDWQDQVTMNMVEQYTTVNIIYLTMLETNAACEVVTRHPATKALVESSTKYDLIISEIFAPDCLVGFAKKFEAPLVGVISSMALPWALDRVANPDNPSYTVNYFWPAMPRMNFIDRVINTAVYGISRGIYWYYSERFVDENVPKELGQEFASTGDVLRNTSLILVNSHFSINQARPFLPSVIEVGGLHIQKPKSLPKDLQEFLDNSSQGAIYFSLGTMTRSDSFHPVKLNDILKVFESIPQKVLWKCDGANLPRVPKNVWTSKWFPQNDILNHRNVKVFITHAGLMGTQEGVAAGVPLLAIPMFGDQHINAKIIQQNGNGIKLDYKNIDEASFRDAIDQLLNNKRYLAKAKELSVLFRDRPLSPLETAIYWIEYVIRHKGAYHLRSAAMDLHWFQYLLLDVVGAIILVHAICLVTIRKIYMSVKSSRKLVLRAKKHQ